MTVEPAALWDDTPLSVGIFFFEHKGRTCDWRGAKIYRKLFRPVQLVSEDIMI
jgi:hypothetical protein